MENAEKLSWLWPFKGGTWQERLMAFPYVLELALMATAIYCLFWTLAS
jgi:hypothetical protein